MTRISAVAATAVGLFIALAAPAFAQYGALAYDPNTRLWGRATNMPSPREAESTALSYCRSPNCRIVTRTGPGQCAAIAASANGGSSHYSTRPGRAEAEAAAVERCENEAHQPCHLVVVQCNQ